MENFLNIRTAYYGLDLWFGRARPAFRYFRLLPDLLAKSFGRGWRGWGGGCICGFLFARFAAQYGFVVYNFLLMAIMLRGYVNLSRYQAGNGAPAG